MNSIAKIYGLTDTAEITQFVGKLPPLNLYYEIKPEYFIFLQKVYTLVGKTLDAFFSNKANPITTEDNELSQFVNIETHKYLMWATMLFQSERFLRIEAKKQGLTYTDNRQDLLKQVISEDCMLKILPLTLDCYEESPHNIIADYLKDYNKYLDGEISKELFKTREERFKKHKSKLNQDIQLEELIKMTGQATYFCGQVFKKYRKHLPGYKAWVEATGAHFGNPRKLAVINREITGYPGRGKGRGERESLS